MPLFANFVGLPYPTAHFGVKFRFGLHPQIVRMTALVERFDFVETRTVDAPGKNKVTDKMRLSRRAAGEAHARLENNPRLLRDHVRTAAGRYKPGKLLENNCYLRLAPSKQVA